MLPRRRCGIGGQRITKVPIVSQKALNTFVLSTEVILLIARKTMSLSLVTFDHTFRFYCIFIAAYLSVSYAYKQTITVPWICYMVNVILNQQELNLLE